MAAKSDSKKGDIATVAFGTALKRIREASKYHHASDLAKDAGLEPHTYRTYEAGKAEPRFSTLIRICQLLGVSPNDLLPGNWKDGSR